MEVRECQRSVEVTFCLPFIGRDGPGEHGEELESG